jgi:hypothetical protein
MPRTTSLFGILFLVLGIAGYLLSGAESVTALIPAFLGAVFLLAGWLAQREHLRKHVMHVAVALGLLAFLGTVRALPKVFAMLGGETVDRPAAVVSQALMAVLSLAYVALGVKSFIDARKARA